MSDVHENQAFTSPERANLRTSSVFFLRFLGRTAADARNRGSDWLKDTVYKDIDSECFVMEPKGDGHSIDLARRVMIILAKTEDDGFPPIAWIEDTSLGARDPKSVFEFTSSSFGPVDAEFDDALIPQIEDESRRHMVGEHGEVDDDTPIGIDRSEVERQLAVSLRKQVEAWHTLIDNEFVLARYDSLR